MMSSQLFKNIEWSDLIMHASMLKNKWAQCTFYKANINTESEHCHLS